jgi:recombination protein RecR
MDSNKYLPEAVSNLIEELNKLPTIGKKSAQRLAFYLLRQPAHDLEKLAGSVNGIKDNIQFCNKCFNLTEKIDLCKICSSHSRNHKVVCVVEEVLDMIAIENTLEFNGLYHVLHGALSPLDGVGPDSLKLNELFNRIKNPDAESEPIEELILATSTNTEGEATALYIYENLKASPVKISRIASGLPVGGDLDYADEVTLKRALRGRSGF